MLKKTSLLLLCCGLLPGCAAFPDVVAVPGVHNPFPQLHKVAVLPFYNQSEEPTVDGEQVALAYYEELQKVPGFEVVPVGVTTQLMANFQNPPSSPQDFQQIARILGVDAVVVGAVTDYQIYYPPKMGISVRWYSANPCFHKIPVGYGLPWGTEESEDIPDSLVFEAEFELAQAQLKTQTPNDTPRPVTPTKTHPAQHTEDLPPPRKMSHAGEFAEVIGGPLPNEPELPQDWPNPGGFVPAAPRAEKPVCRPNYDAIIRHTKLYDGSDAKFTQALSEYYYHNDDARFGGWQSYLQRSDDFIHFCCHLHVYQTLAARGGADETRVVWRWPISRYER